MSIDLLCLAIRPSVDYYFRRWIILFPRVTSWVSFRFAGVSVRDTGMPSADILNDLVIESAISIARTSNTILQV